MKDKTKLSGTSSSEARFDELATLITDSGNELGIRLLLLDCDDAHSRLLLSSLSTESYAIDFVHEHKAMIERIRQTYYHLLIVKLSLLEQKPEDFMDYIRTSSPGTKLIGIAESREFEAAVELVRAGAIDCLSHPVPLARLTELVQEALSSGIGAGNLQEISPPGGYRIIKTIAMGDVSTVILLRKQIDHRDYAMKVLIGGGGNGNDLAAIRRFFREAKVLASIEHPNIVRIHEYGFSPENIPFIVMEYIHGHPLSDLIADKNFDILRRTLVFEQLAKALATVHERGVLHRDIRPCNVLVTPTYVAKLADFGLAGIADSTLTMAREVLGPPAYLSPEAWDKPDTVDERSDIFSLGVMAYELFTRKKPFHGKTPMQLHDAIHHENPPAPHSINPEISYELQDIIGRMLAKDPAQRWQSARELVEALRQSEGKSPGIGTRAMRIFKPKSSVWK